MFKKKVKSKEDIEKEITKLEKQKEETGKIEKLADIPPPPPAKPKHLKDEIRELKELIMEGGKRKRKQKGFKLPFSIRMKAKKAWKKNKVLVFLLKNNKIAMPVIAKLQDGLVLFEGGQFHNASVDFFFMWRGKIPCLFVPEWDLNPIGTNEYYEAVKEKRTTDAQTTIIRMIENRENQPKKKIGGSMIMWILLGVGVIYLISQGLG